MCKRLCGICCLVVINLLVLLACATVILLLLWADHNWDASLYLGNFSLNQMPIVYYILYGVVGGIAGVALLGLIACCCSKTILMTVYAIICIGFLVR